MPIQNNKIGSGYVTVLEVSNTNYLLSDFATSGNETVHEITIVSVAWSGAGTVSRGANTVLNLTGSSQWLNTPITQDSTANVQITTSGTIYLELHKRSGLATTEY